MEIELKFRIAQPEPLRRTLESLSARPVGRFFEVNRIYDTPDGRLRAADSAVRVRESCDPAVGSTVATLAFKGPKSAGPLKQREEIETGVVDADALRAILARTGFVETILYEKRREVWVLADCEVVIDELPSLGWFVEVEGPSADAVRACCAAMKLDPADAIRDSYVGLAARHGRDREGRRELTFA
ncbi:MAG: class IV adenylate cyclase [Planctomycetes bacterium]|nr:class IV adenylate cyclase [Planctomycetota bacterium]